MTGKKLTRKQLLRVIGDCQTLFGRAEAQYQNDRDPNRAENVTRTCREGFNRCLEALANEDPQ